MSKCLRTKCRSEDAAISAFGPTDRMLDTVEGITSIARKRSGASIVWRFVDGPSVIAEVVARFERSGIFESVDEMSDEQFRSAPSNSI